MSIATTTLTLISFQILLQALHFSLLLCVYSLVSLSRPFSLRYYRVGCRWLGMCDTGERKAENDERWMDHWMCPALHTVAFTNETHLGFSFFLSPSFSHTRTRRAQSSSLRLWRALLPQAFPLFLVLLLPFVLLFFTFSQHVEPAPTLLLPGLSPRTVTA